MKLPEFDFEVPRDKGIILWNLILIQFPQLDPCRLPLSRLKWTGRYPL